MVTHEQIEGLRDRFKIVVPPSSNNGKFNLEKYLSHYGVETTGTKQVGTSTFYLLKECVFDPSHTADESAIGITAEGKLFYQCFHNSCQGKEWKDARPIISGKDFLAQFIEGYNQKKPEKADGQQINNRFRFLSISEIYFCNTPTEWLIKDYLDKNSLAQIFGEPGSMKSFMALDMGLCIAIKNNWHGHPVKVQGPVFYIAGEGLSGFGKRLKAWEKDHGISLEDVHFFVSDRPAQFLDESSALEVESAVDDLVEKHGIPVLIIIDTLNRNFGPGDENFTSDMTCFVNIVDAQLRIKYKCTVLIIHHNGLTNQDRGRGSSALRASLDWEYSLIKNTTTGICTLKNTKTKDHEPPPPISFKPEIITLDELVDEDGEVVTSCVLHETDSPVQGKKPLTQSQRIAMSTLESAIEEFGEDGKVHIDHWRKQAYAKSISSGSTEAKQKAFSRAISDLRKQGMIDTLNDYYWLMRNKFDFNDAKVPGHTGHLPDIVDIVREQLDGQTGHIPLGMSVMSGCFENKKDKGNFTHEEDDMPEVEGERWSCPSGKPA